MANFTFKSFTELLQQALDTVTANATNLINLGEGSVIRVLMEAVCGLLDYYTILLKRILLITRAKTSEGEDLDTFVADYGMTPRTPATYAEGNVIFSRKAANVTQLLIPVGSRVFSNDGSVEFEVMADSNLTGYDPNSDSYVILSNQLSVTARVRALTAGTAGNILANTATLLGSSLPGVDVVTNSDPFIGAAQEESDEALRARFIKFIASLVRATKGAIEYAIEIVQAGLEYVLAENVDINNNVKFGHFTVVVDDGTGSPTPELLQALFDSINQYRAFTVTFNVYGPTLLSTDASCVLTYESGYSQITVANNVKQTIENYLNTRTFGEFVAVNRIADLAFNVAGVKDVEMMMLNGSLIDVQPAFNEKVKAGTVTVT